MLARDDGWAAAVGVLARDGDVLGRCVTWAGRAEVEIFDYGHLTWLLGALFRPERKTGQGDCQFCC